MPTAENIFTLLGVVLAAFVLFVVVIVIIAIVSTILALVRNSIIEFLHSVVDMVARPFVWIARAVLTSKPPLASWITQAMTGMAYTSTHTPNLPASSNWPLWILIGPLVYLVIVLLMAAGDWYFATVGFAVLLGQNPSIDNMPFDLDASAGLLFVVLSLIFGFMVFDMYEGSPIHRPWSNFHASVIKVLRIVGIAGVIVTAMAGIFFMIFRQMQANKRTLDELNAAPQGFEALFSYLIWVMLALLLVVGTGLAGWAVFTSLGSLYALLMMGIRLILDVARGVTYLMVQILDGLAFVVTAFVDVFATRGMAIWNWLCARPPGQRLGLVPVTFVARPRVGADINQPLF